MNSRTKMCSNKDTFWSRERAERSAERYGQRVYECPICFCWHCTSKDDWRDEFVSEDVVKRQLATLENKLRAEFNAKRKALNLRIMEMERENKQLRKLAQPVSAEASKPEAKE